MAIRGAGRGRSAIVGLALALGVAVSGGVAAAQDAPAGATAAAAEAPRGTRLAFGSVRVTADEPISVVSDTLSMDQNVNTATFVGNVLVEQGELVLNADTVLVEYGGGGENATKGIIRVVATGGVRMVTPDETAAGDEAIYTVETRQIVVTGNVVVTQGFNRVAGERLEVDLEAGTATMIGRVRTVIDTTDTTGTTGPTPPESTGQ